MPSVRDYQQRAFAEVGLTAWDAERLRGEHDCVSAADTIELLDLGERSRLMRAIAAAYATLYLRRPEAFLWMGFAAIAVHDGVRPSAELAAEAAGLEWLQALDRSPVGRAASLLFGARPAAAARDGIRAAFEANLAIFSDVFWVHLAYLEGGVETLRALGVGGDLLAGLAQLDRGWRRGPAGYGDVVAGNRLLFRHEQQRAVTPVFAKYHRAMAFATRVGLIGVPNRRLRRECEELDRPAEWVDASVAGVSYGPFAARWRWLESSSWEPFVRLHQHHRDDLHREVWRAVTGAPEA